MTMTIVGYDPRTGQFGGAVATKNPAVGLARPAWDGRSRDGRTSSVETQRRRGMRCFELGFPAPSPSRR
jgi:uncharacterized Ntn-hydrolase superfamily protein